MKIDSYRQNFDPTLKNDRTEAAARIEDRRGIRPTAADQRDDQVRVSPEAQLASRALTRASEPDAIRTTKVERAKQLVASGELGNDAGRLADAIINRAIENDG